MAHSSLARKRTRGEKHSWFYRVSRQSPCFAQPDVVLVHGLVVPGITLVPLAERLASAHRIFVPDLPGFGKSPKPAHALNLVELADALEEWARTIGLGRAAFVGSSFGSQVVALLAVRHPERIGQAVLIGPTIDPQARSLSSELPRWFNHMKHRLLALPALVYLYCKAGMLRSLRTLQFTLQDRIEEHLPNITIPTLVIRGSQDTIVPQRWVEEVQRLLPYGELALIEGASHDAQDDHLLELARTIEQFLARFSVPGQAGSGATEGGA